MNIKDFGNLDNTYIRIGNQHIFIQLRGDWMPIIKEIAEKGSHQRIHIFELYPTAIADCYKYIIEKVSPETRVICHFYKKMKDYKIWLDHLLSDTSWEGHNKNWTIVLDGAPVSFKYFARNFANNVTERSFVVKFTREPNSDFKICSYIEGKPFTLDDMDYYALGGEGCAVSTRLRKKYPELFKQQIITDFKKTTPKGILDSFSSDDDIFEYVLEAIGGTEWKAEQQIQS